MLITNSTVSENIAEMKVKIVGYSYEEETKEITTVSVLLNVIKKIMLIYINFSFDFLGLDNVDF